MGKVISIKDSDNRPIPDDCPFHVYDATEYSLYFEDKNEAIHHAKLNACAVKDIRTNEIIIDCLYFNI